MRTRMTDVCLIKLTITSTRLTQYSQQVDQESTKQSVGRTHINIDHNVMLQCRSTVSNILILLMDVHKDGSTINT